LFYLFLFSNPNFTSNLDATTQNKIQHDAPFLISLLIFILTKRNIFH
jgi:hypothetical protein